MQFVMLFSVQSDAILYDSIEKKFDTLFSKRFVISMQQEK